ncbi:MAG: glycosyltransferase family 4 protein, partial [Bdellovibrionales bacterium]|nr:glycosyltransferase family 4 protein [Bdellovibrionales bacterium]
RNIPLVRWGDYLRSCHSKWEVAHIHLPNPLALKALMASSIKKVATIHAYPHNHPILARFYQPIFSHQMGKIDRVVFTSETLKEAFIRRNLLWAKKSDVVNLGISDLEEDEQGNQCHNRLRVREILFVGRLVKYKGLPSLLRALCLLPKRIGLSVVGGGPERKTWEGMTQSLGLGSRVTFHGELSHRDLIFAYQKCHIVALPSLNEAEAFGLSLVEGLRSGKPLISPLVNTGILEVNLDKRTGLSFNVSKIEGLAAAISKLFHDQELYSKLSEQARLHYLEKFQRSKMIDEYERIYRSLL